MKLWSFTNDSFLSISDSKGMSFLSEYVNTHSYFPSPLYRLDSFHIHSNQHNRPSKKPIRPPSSFTPPWRHVAGSAPCGAYGDAAPCAMAAGFGPLVVMAWHHLWKFRIKVVWSDFTWTPLILVDCDMWLDWKGMIFKWFVQSLCLMSENMLRLGMSMMMLQWQLISCRTRMLHISRCALQSTISWTWWLSFGAPIRQGTDSETFPQKAWCHCNPTVVIITSILEYGVYSLNIKRVFRFVFFLFFFGDLLVSMLVGSVGPESLKTVMV